MGTVSSKACSNVRDLWLTKELLSTRTEHPTQRDGNRQKGGWAGLKREREKKPHLLMNSLKSQDLNLNKEFNIQNFNYETV